MTPQAAMELPPAYAYDSPSTTAVSSSATTLFAHWHDARAHSQVPVSRQAVEDRFEDLRLTWIEQRGASSRAEDIILAHAYQQIIALGARAVPLIIRSMRERPDHWFWALNVITGVDPIDEEMYGDVPRMTRAWLDWAAKSGF
jgi:hypothetical protein